MVGSVRDVRIALLFASTIALVLVALVLVLLEEVGGEELGNDTCFCRS